MASFIGHNTAQPFFYSLAVKCAGQLGAPVAVNDPGIEHTAPILSISECDRPGQFDVRLLKDNEKQLITQHPAK